VRRALTGLGCLTAAFLVFVGLLHAVLIARGRHTPETLGAFHDWPVLGGFFPKHAEAADQPTPAQQREAAASEWLADSRNEFKLPPPFTASEIESLVRELKDSRARADADRQRYEAELLDLERMRREIEANREALNDTADALETRARELIAARDELDRERTFVREEETRNFKTLAAMYESMPAEDAAAKLEGLEDDVVAKVVGRMSERKAGRILAAMSTPRAVAITKKLQAVASLPPAAAKPR
jgi:flagellar motility protein MotE (MotC chaperone)